MGEKQSGKNRAPKGGIINDYHVRGRSMEENKNAVPFPRVFHWEMSFENIRPRIKAKKTLSRDAAG
jgi:hypothetical protein